MLFILFSGAQLDQESLIGQDNLHVCIVKKETQPMHPQLVVILAI